MSLWREGVMGDGIATHVSEQEKYFLLSFFRRLLRVFGVRINTHTHRRRICTYLSVMSGKTYTLVVVRHGESEWNKANLFTGWADPDLTVKGREEAKTGGVQLKAKGFQFDVAYTSVLKRAIKTLYIIQDEMNLHWIPVRRRWRLGTGLYLRGLLL